MLDLQHLPNSSQIKDFRTFTPGATGSTIDSWQTWTKPRGCSWLYGLVISAGGGGGRPATGAVQGAGGGANGSVATFMIPAYYVSDTLYIRPGIGGAGASSTNSSGATGDTSYIATQPNINNESVLLTATAGTFGQAAATSGIAASAAVFSNQLTLAIVSTGTGSNGGTGGNSGAGGGARTWGQSNVPPICSGAGGAGGNASDQAGGGITATGGAGVAPFASIATVNAQRGPDGHGFNKPIPDLRNPHSVLPYLALTGGAGGGASNGGTGGAGGHGAYGCGGGGGGGGNTTGNGGNGGDALIILIAW